MQPFHVKVQLLLIVINIRYITRFSHKIWLLILLTTEIDAGRSANKQTKLFKLFYAQKQHIGCQELRIWIDLNSCCDLEILLQSALMVIIVQIKRLLLK